LLNRSGEKSREKPIDRKSTALGHSRSKKGEKKTAPVARTPFQGEIL
jgi:hypothetical protein